MQTLSKIVLQNPKIFTMDYSTVDHYMVKSSTYKVFSSMLN
jgi:hypothetical protein